MEKGKQFLWTRECDMAFNSMKRLLTGARILMNQFIIDCDASQNSMGAVLSQSIDDAC